MGQTSFPVFIEPLSHGGDMSKWENRVWCSALRGKGNLEAPGAGTPPENGFKGEEAGGSRLPSPPFVSFFPVSSIISSCTVRLTLVFIPAEIMVSITTFHY